MAAEILSIKNLKKYFETSKGTVHAVDNVSFSMEKGETLGIVGESGCGKSTLGRTILRLLEPTDGEIYFQGKDVIKFNKRELIKLRGDMQMIFQDPFSSLNPRMSVGEIIAEPLIIHGIIDKNSTLEERVLDLMEIVGLADRLIDSYPHELDGGRRQRIGIARALALRPKFIVADEPVSALDVSIQAQILNLMQELQEELDLTYMFITHDLSVIKHISDNIGVMYLGKIVEKASSKALFKNPYHPYTQALLSAIPVPSINYKRERIILKGEIASPLNPEPGCRFAPRCNYAIEKCLSVEPELLEKDEDHFVACHVVMGT